MWPYLKLAMTATPLTLLCLCSYQATQPTWVSWRAALHITLKNCSITLRNSPPRVTGSIYPFCLQPVPQGHHLSALLPWNLPESILHVHRFTSSGHFISWVFSQTSSIVAMVLVLLSEHLHFTFKEGTRPKYDTAQPFKTEAMECLAFDFILHYQIHF